MSITVRDYEKYVYLCEPSYDAASKTLTWQERKWCKNCYKKERFVLEYDQPKLHADPIWNALSERSEGTLKEYRISLDGTLIAYITAKEKEQEKLPETWKAPIVAEGGSYRRDSDGGWKINRTWELHICDAAYQNHRTVFESTEAIHALNWALDGSCIVFEDVKSGNCYYAADLTGNAVSLSKEIHAALGGAGSCFLNEKTVLVAGIRGSENIIGYELFALRTDGNGEIDIKWEGEVPDEVFPQIANGSPFLENNQQICPTGKKDTVAVIGCKKGEVSIYLLTITEAEHTLCGMWKRLTDGTGSFSAICRGEAGYLYALRSDWNHPSYLVKLCIANGSVTPVYDANTWILESRLSRTTNFKCSTLDGSDTLDGWILEPANRTEEKIPAVLLVHGGPLMAYVDAFAMEAQLLAQAGMGVILVNPRGSSGYGKSYASYDKAFDGTAANDLLYYMDCALRAFPWIDGNRLGVAGGSYGGYMSAWLAGHCKRFKTAVVMRGLLNFEFLYLTSQASGNPGMYEEPTSFEDLLMKTTLESPNTYAQEMDLPMLIMHGEADANCPIYGAHQLYVAVKDNHPDQPVRFILFPGVGHNIRAARLDYYQRYETELVNWLKKYL